MEGDICIIYKMGQLEKKYIHIFRQKFEIGIFWNPRRNCTERYFEIVKREIS